MSETSRKAPCQTFDSREGEVGRVRSAGSRRSVRARVGNAREEPLFEPIAQSGDAGRVQRKRSKREFGSFAETDNAGNIFRAGAEAALMMAAEEKLAKTCAALDEERANSFRGVQLVAGEGKQVQLEGPYVDRKFADRLHGVGVEEQVGFGGDAPDFCEGLNGAELVVRVHDGDQHRVGPNGPAKFVQIDQAINRDGKIGDGDALFFESLAGVEDGFVFDGRGNNVLRRRGCGGDDTEDGLVVGLGASAGKDNLLRAGVEERRNLIARVFDGRPGALAEGVDRRGVAKIGGEEGKHSVEDGRIDGGRSVVIKVNVVQEAAKNPE